MYSSQTKDNVLFRSKTVPSNKHKQNQCIKRLSDPKSVSLCLMHSPARGVCPWLGARFAVKTELPDASAYAKMCVSLCESVHTSRAPPQVGGSTRGYPERKSPYSVTGLAATPPWHIPLRPDTKCVCLCVTVRLVF